MKNVCKSNIGIMPLAQKQQGAALIVSLLILSIVIVITTASFTEHNFQIRRVSNQLAASQAYSYLRATEAVAHKALMTDLEIDKENGEVVDHLAEIWAQEAPPFMLEEGAYTGRLFDLQGRFNINSLLNDSSNSSNNKSKAVPYNIEQGIFIRLLIALNDDDFSISSDEAQSITESIVDYLDSDTQVRGFDCGEDDAYYSIEGRLPHRTANQAMVSVSELRLICNLPVELFRRLREHVTVWPLSGESTINLNTASEPLLRAVLIDELDEAKLNNLSPGYFAPQPLEPFQLEDVLSSQASGYVDFNSMEVDFREITWWPNAPLSLASDYFLLASDAKLGDVLMHMESVISRKGGTISILARSTDGL